MRRSQRQEEKENIDSDIIRSRVEITKLHVSFLVCEEKESLQRRLALSNPQAGTGNQTYDGKTGVTGCRRYQLLFILHVFISVTSKM